MVGNQETVNWMGDEIETLSDLFPPSPRAICVGINPAPVSVAAGHYYQGQLGQRFLARLVEAGVCSPAPVGLEDDAAVEEGIGFTDVVKRPTARADEVRAEELQHGQALLTAKLVTMGEPALIFPFKAAAVALVGKFTGNGWLRSEFQGCPLFVMPGPFERRSSAEATLATMGARLA